MADDAGGTENNIPYDIEFLDGVFTHLAIVDNPRYERANIVFNSKTVVTNATEDAQGNLHSESNGQFVSKNNNKSFYNEKIKTIELKGNELGFTDEEIRENGLKYFKENYQGKKFDNPELKGILFSNPGIKKFYTNSADIHKIKAIPALKDIIEKGKYQGAEDLAHPRQDGIIKFHRINHDVSINGHKENMSVLIGEDRDGNRFYNLNNKTYTAKNSSRGERAIGVADEEFSINIITDIQEDFNPDMKNNKVVNDKWITIHPNGEGSKGRPLLLKDGENVYDAMRRQWGISSPGQQHLFSIGKYKTDDSYKRELDAKIAEFNKQFKKSRQEEARRKEEAIETDIQKLEKDAYIIKYANKFGYFGAAEKWDKGHKLNNNKENTDMALLDELKKLITKVENDKGDDMDDKEKVENEKVDKRKLIDEVAGIMKSAGADDELIRTAIGKMEKIAYDKSEAGTADNEKEDDKPADDSKVENEETKKDEEEYKDLKKDVKEDVKNKCKNSVDNAKGGYFDKMNEIYNSAIKPKEENMYISREQKLKNAEEYFAK